MFLTVKLFRKKVFTCGFLLLSPFNRELATGQKLTQLGFVPVFNLTYLVYEQWTKPNLPEPS